MEQHSVHQGAGRSPSGVRKAISLPSCGGFSIRCLFREPAQGFLHAAVWSMCHVAVRVVEVNKLRVQVVGLLARHGHEGSRRPTDEPSPVHFKQLSATLQACGDPDCKVFNTYATGVRFGVGVKMPRTLAVYAPKRSWKLPRQRDPEAHDPDLHDSGVFQFGRAIPSHAFYVLLSEFCKCANFMVVVDFLRGN